MKIKYSANGAFDIKNIEISVPDGAPDCDILSSILDDLVDRYGLNINYVMEENHGN